MRQFSELAKQAVQFKTEEEWVKWRSEANRISGSDVSAILGVSPWRGEWDVWNSKKNGLEQSISDSKAKTFARGRKWEARVLDDYADETGVQVFTSPSTIYAHPVYAWAIGTPDGFVGINADNIAGGIEAKTSISSDSWGESGTVIRKWGEGSEKVVPPYYALQCYWYMEITGMEFWDLAVLIPRPREFPELRHYRLMKDESIQSSLINTIGDWRENRLLNDNPPEVDGSDGCRDALNEIPFSGDKRLRAATSEEDSLVAQYLQTNSEIASLEEKKALAGNKLLAAVGEGYGISGSSGKVIVVRSTGRTSYRIDSLIEEHPELAQTIAKYAKTSNQFTQIRATKPKD